MYSPVWYACLHKYMPTARQPGYILMRLAVDEVGSWKSLFAVTFTEKTCMHMTWRDSCSTHSHKFICPPDNAPSSFTGKTGQKDSDSDQHFLRLRLRRLKRSYGYCNGYTYDHGWAYGYVHNYCYSCEYLFYKCMYVTLFVTPLMYVSSIQQVCLRVCIHACMLRLSLRLRLQLLLQLWIFVLQMYISF